MAKKEDETGVVKIKHGRSTWSIPVTAILAALAAVGGNAGLDAVTSQKPTAIEAAQPSVAPTDFVTLRESVNAHHVQQEKDCTAQQKRDESQDEEIKVWRSAIEMLNTNLGQLNTKLENLQPQLNQAQQDVRILTADIKELLRRGNPQP